MEKQRQNNVSWKGMTEQAVFGCLFLLLWVMTHVTVTVIFFHRCPLCRVSSGRMSKSQEQDVRFLPYTSMFGFVMCNDGLLINRLKGKTVD